MYTHLALGQQILEDNIDAAMIRVVVALEFHKSGQFLFNRLAQVCLINDA